MQVEKNLNDTKALKNQAQSSAENAALSEHAAKSAEVAAREARS